MIAFMRRRDLGDTLPEQLPGLAVKAHQIHFLLGWRAAAPDPAATSAHGRLGGGRRFAGWDGGGDENPVAPDHRGGMAAAGDIGSPLDVVRVAPTQGRFAASD